MEVCGEAENRLASELMHHELQIEKDVLDPLSQLAEVRKPGNPSVDEGNKAQVKYLGFFHSSWPVLKCSHTPAVCFLWSNNSWIDCLIEFWGFLSSGFTLLSCECRSPGLINALHIGLFW